jgi:hypothetical protein
MEPSTRCSAPKRGRGDTTVACTSCCSVYRSRKCGERGTPPTYHSYLHQGITFTDYGREEGTERIFPHDLLPRIVTSAGWETIERGLMQRIKGSVDGVASVGKRPRSGSKGGGLLVIRSTRRSGPRNDCAAATTAVRGNSALPENEPKRRAVSQAEILHPLAMRSSTLSRGLRRMIPLGALLGGVS